jgi:hypothetical protein
MPNSPRSGRRGRCRAERHAAAARVRLGTQAAAAERVRDHAPLLRSAAARTRARVRERAGVRARGTRRLSVRGTDLNACTILCYDLEMISVIFPIFDLLFLSNLILSCSPNITTVSHARSDFFSSHLVSCTHILSFSFITPAAPFSRRTSAPGPGRNRATSPMAIAPRIRSRSPLCRAAPDTQSMSM